VLAGQSRHRDAVEKYLRAVQLAPGYVAAWNNLGLSQQALGLRREAEASYRRALAIDPGFAPARTNLNSLYSP
jgi:tetratricopeptide (TPR) repeat protein